METCELPRALDALLDGREPRCAPWWCWLALALCRQRVAQSWLVEVAPTLEGEDGEVPGHPGWRATFHGRGLCLEGPRGALVDMDFGAHAGEDIDPWFFASRVRAMDGGVEAEVRRWLGSDGVLVAALEALRRDGHLWHPTSTHVFRLSAPLEAMAARVARASWRDDFFAEPAAGLLAVASGVLRAASLPGAPASVGVLAGANDESAHVAAGPAPVGDLAAANVESAHVAAGPAPVGVLAGANDESAHVAAGPAPVGELAAANGVLRAANLPGAPASVGVLAAANGVLRAASLSGAPASVDVLAAANGTADSAAHGAAEPPVGVLAAANGIDDSAAYGAAEPPVAEASVVAEAVPVGVLAAANTPGAPARDSRRAEQPSFFDLLRLSDEVPGEGAHARWLGALLADRERAARMVPTVARLLRREAFSALFPHLLRTADHLAAATLEQCDLLGLDATALAAPLLEAVTDGRHPFIGVRVCRHLLRHDVEAPRALAAVRSLAAVVNVKGYIGNPMLDDLAFILLEFGDELEARRVVRRALRGAPACAEAVAVLLSLLRSRWALDELRNVAADSSLEGPSRRRAAIALRMAGVVAEAPPAVESAGVGFTFDEVDAARLADQGLLVTPELQSLAERLRR